MQQPRPLALVIMGVSGSGKTTIGRLLSERSGYTFIEADTHHPASNIKKMTSGIPLDDADRTPWLKSLHKELKDQLEKGQHCILACSALKARYRRMLDKDIRDRVRFIHLRGDFETIQQRINARHDHFMNADLLASQFDTLEDPVEATVYDIEGSPEALVQQIWTDLTTKAEFGVIGMGVMGGNISMNLGNRGFRLALYNREVKGKEEDLAKKLIAQHDELSGALPFNNLTAFVNSLQTPRKILVMVPAGEAVENIIDQLSGVLSPGDVIIDGGNSHYLKTASRREWLTPKGILFLGCGISGGAKGAYHGPALMPGGDADAYVIVAPYLLAMAAKDKDGNPCCSYLGKDGAGHFVKTIHNGIEYAEMQLLAEVYHLYKATGCTDKEIHEHFTTLDRGELSGFLLNITCKILDHYEDGELLLDQILDKAGNKGTGNWATVAAAASGVPATMISNALFARYISFFKERREQLENTYPKMPHKMVFPPEEIKQAYTLARIINHSQGFGLLRAKQDEYGYDLHEIARIWTNGCIIRSRLMEMISSVLGEEPDLLNNQNFIPDIRAARPCLESLVIKAIKAGISVPALSDALNYLNGITTANGPAHLIQAQRDFFGAHTYQKRNDPDEQFFHTNWD